MGRTRAQPTAPSWVWRRWRLSWIYPNWSPCNWWSTLHVGFFGLLGVIHFSHTAESQAIHVGPNLYHPSGTSAPATSQSVGTSNMVAVVPNTQTQQSQTTKKRKAYISWNFRIEWKFRQEGDAFSHQNALLISYLFMHYNVFYCILVTRHTTKTRRLLPLQAQRQRWQNNYLCSFYLLIELVFYLEFIVTNTTDNQHQGSQGIYTNREEKNST